jgi:hypothetical protein
MSSFSITTKPGSRSRGSKGGFFVGMPKGGNQGSGVAYLTSHDCVPAVRSGSGYCDSPAVARTFDGHYNYALHAYESRFHAKCRRELEGSSDNLVTPCTKMQQQGSKVSPKFPLKAVASYT